VAAAVWQWFAQLWQQVQPGAVVPITSRVLLLDDFSAWAPPADKQLLWTHLRLLLLESIYSVSSSCSSNRQASSSTAGGGGSSSGATAAAAAAAVQGSNGDGEPEQAAQNGSSSFSAKAVACRFCAELKRQLSREWDRVEVDVRLGSEIPLSWLGGRSPVICWVDFQHKWAGLYRVSREWPERRIMLKISTDGL
jgi:hypothetical protein